MNLSLALGFFICSFASFAFYFLFSVVNGTRANKLSISNSYPFEYQMNMPMYQRVLSYMFMVAGTVFASAGFLATFFEYKTFYGYSLGVLSIIAVLALCVSHMLSFKQYTYHLILAAISFFLTPLSLFMTGLSAFISDITSFETIVLKPFGVIFMIFGVLLLIMMFNPKLKEWGKLDKTEIDGKTVYVKPRINFFALNEWLVLVSTSIYMLLFFVNHMLIVF